MTFKTSGTLSLAGNITLGTNNATLGNALSMGTGTNYFLTNSTGVLKRSVGNAGTFAFPVGNSAYNPVSITNNTGAADEFNLRVLDEVYRNGTSGSVLTTPRVKRTWLIGKTNANAGSGINFVFNWNTGESTSGLNSPRLYHYNGTEWDKQTGTTSSTSSSLTYTGYTGTFSPFAIGDDIQALPVTLLYFNCHANENKGNVLRWATATELNSKQFEVERSTDGKIYQTIGKIPAAGHSLTTKPYEFIDKSTVGNMTAYRLKMIDEDGSFKYSEPCVVLHHESGSDKILIYPNPSQGSFTVEAEAPGQFKIVDAIGRVVQQGNISGKTTINGLLPGVYFITFQTEEKRYTQKVVVE
jgi:hypothetical protein